MWGYTVVCIPSAMNVKKQRATLFATLSIGELYQKPSKKEAFLKGLEKQNSCYSLKANVEK